MTFLGEKRYTFVSGAKAEDTFAVVRFSGHEAISQPYRFDIELATEDAEIDLRAMLQKPARFVIHRGDLDDRVFNGVLAEFEQMKESGGHVLYKAVLVPRLWNAGLYHENQLFLEKSVKDIIKEVLQQTRLTGEDYALRLTGAYTPWEYLCQWRETDLNFIHRWMEREGIYYYFDQDGQTEKMIITDSAASHQPIGEPSQIPYSPPSGTVPRHQEVIHSMVCRQQRLPNKVMLRDYNYRRPSLELKAEATVDAAGQGEVYFYGDHFKTPEEGTHLANVRAQELLCRECVFNGESTAAHLCAGYQFTLQDHYRDNYNQPYLVVEVHHHGHQAVAGLAGQQSDLSDGEKQMEYTNRFTAIPANVQFRPERNATKPKFYGTLNATVDAAGNGEYAEIDDQGRYKVIMPFDRSGIRGGRASRWTRMAQPYAGNNYGMHFPLHSGTEVLLTFVDGDPDRPIISGSVPNPETGSPVSTGNQTQSMIRTGGGNQVRLEDTAGGQQIHLSSPTEGSIISLGAPNKGNLYLKTDGTSIQEVGSFSKRTIGGFEETTIGGYSKRTIKGLEQTEIKGNSECRVLEGNREIYVLKGNEHKNIRAGDRDIYVYEGKEKIWIKSDVEHTYKAKLTTMVTNAIQLFSIDSNIDIRAREKISSVVDGKSKLEIKGEDICLEVGKSKLEMKVKEICLGVGKSKLKMEEEKICLEVGKSKLYMKKDGTIEFKGLKVTVKGQDSVEISGKEINTVGKSNTNVSGSILRLN